MKQMLVMQARVASAEVYGIVHRTHGFADDPAATVGEVPIRYHVSIDEQGKG